MEKKEKEFYVPPTVKVTQVILECSIAVQSPIQQVDLEDWYYDEYPLNHDSNNSDVWLDI